MSVRFAAAALLTGLMLAAASPTAFAQTPPAPMAPAVGPAPSAGPSPLLKMVEEGIPALEAKAAKGDADAMYRLALAYEHGLTVSADHDESMDWYLRAAKAGSPSAMNNYGLALWQDGASLEAQRTGVGWIEMAAKAGLSNAMANLATVYADDGVYPKDESKAFAWLTAAAEHGDVPSMLMLALYYETGTHGATKSRTQAIRWYREVVAKDDSWRKEAAESALKDLGAG